MDTGPKQMLYNNSSSMQTLRVFMILSEEQLIKLSKLQRLKTATARKV